MRWWPLTLRGAGALAFAVGGVVGAQAWGSVELLAISVLLVTLLLGSLASLYLVARPAEATRDLRPAVPRAGEPAEVRVAVNVRTALPSAAGAWRDGVPRDARVDAAGESPGGAGGVFATSASGLRAPARAVTVGYRVRFARRGVHTLGPFGLTLLDPFGLTRRMLRVGGRTRVVVAPAVVELVGGFRVAGGPGGTPHAITAQRGEGADNLVARPYLPGDAMRRIHWRATARHGELMVREEEQEATPDATVVLDRSASRYGDAARETPGADPGFEAAVEACLSVAARLARDGYVVRVIDADGAPLSESLGASDRHDADRLAGALATLTTRPGDALGHVAAQFTGDAAGPVVVVTGRLGIPDTTALAPVAASSAAPVLLAAAPAEDALSTAAATGWRTASIAPGRDLAAAWSAAVERMPNHVVR
jgi:uncharacterized protein (DUF58 family)